MNAFHTNLIELVNRHDGKKTAYSVLKFLSRHLFLMLVLLWTPLILMQTWNIQHSCFPLVNWGGDRCPIEEVTVSPRELQIIATSKHNSDQSASTTLKIPRGIDWLAISTGSIVTAGATLVGVPLPAAIALGSATATGIHNWQAVDPFLCR